MTLFLRALRGGHLVLVALLAGVAPAFATPLAVVAIADADAAQRARLKHFGADAWTLEMGGRLVVVGAAANASSVDVDPDALLLRPRGCNEHGPQADRLLEKGGRWELREVAPSQVDALLAHGWRTVPRNGSVATRWHADAKGAPAPDPRVQQILDRLDATRWFADVQALAAWDRSSYGTDSLVAARDFIATRFDELGLEVELMPFTMNGVGGGSIVRHNVIGSWSGRSQPERWIIVGGHYDSRNNVSTSASPTPGAEDNATGCAGVIELARMLIESEPGRSIAFICYAGEEQGLRGSRAHVAKLQGQDLLSSIDLVATMDMIGYSADGNLEALFESSAAQAPLLARFGQAAALYAPELAVVTSTMPFGSDHVPYIDQGLASVLSIENDWDLYPHYHRTTDTPANIGPHALAMGSAIIKTNAALIAQVAGLPFAGFADGFE